MNRINLLSGIIPLAVAFTGCGGSGSHNPSLDFSKRVDLESAEQQLIAAYGENAASHIEQLILNNPQSLTYDFKALCDTAELTINDSPDGKVRFYSWDTGMGGTCIDWVTYIQYAEDGDTITGQFQPYSKSMISIPGSVEMMDSEDSDEGSDAVCMLQNVHQFTNTKGEKIYLVECYMRESSSIGATYLTAFKFQDGKPVKELFFSTPSEELDAIDYEHEIPGWYFRAANGEGWAWLNTIDPATQTLYIPVVRDMEISDQYLLYKFDGDKLVFDGIDGGFWLHPSVRKFKYLYQIYDTPKVRFRIDEMEDGKLRYASWENGSKMNDKPSLVITGQEKKTRPGMLHFRNCGVDYFTPDPASDKAVDTLVIERAGKVLAKYPVND